MADKTGKISDKIGPSLNEGDNTFTVPGAAALSDVAHQDDKKKMRQETLSRADTDTDTESAAIWVNSQTLLMLSATAL